MAQETTKTENERLFEEAVENWPKTCEQIIAENKKDN